MAVNVDCPGCGTGYPISAELLGKTIRCKKCQETFVARESKGGAASKPDERITTRPGTKPAARVDDEKSLGKSVTKPAAKEGANKTLVAGGAAAGGLILALSGALVWALNREQPANKQNENTVAVAPPPPKAKLGGDSTPPAVEPKTEPKVETPKVEPKVEPKSVETPKVAQAKIEHNSLPGFVRTRRPGEFDPAMLSKLKKQAVLILSTSEDGGGWGSGWVAEQNGDERYIMTNAHVVGMKERAKPAPDALKVYFHAGTDDEFIVEGRLMAVDHDEDLAVIRVKGKDKKGNPLPEPFKLAPSFDLVPGQKLTIIGFPHGGNLKRELQDDPTKEIRVEVKTRPSTVVGRVPRSDGSVKWIQVEGGADHGNSGGGVVDTNGHIVAVLVAGIPGTNMRFVIPSEYAYHLLMGRVLKLIPGQAVKSGATSEQPLRAYIADPLKRLAKVEGEVWTGKAGKIRSATLNAPEPQAGDGPRVKVDLTYKPDQSVKLGDAYTADAKLSLPQLKEGEVYWFQPHYVGKDGKERWGEAVVLEMGRYPVEAKPANLLVKHKAESKPEDRRAIEIQSRRVISGMGGSLNMRANMLERTRSVEKNGDAKVSYQYSDVAFVDKETDDEVRRSFKGALESAKYMKSEATITKDGLFKSAKPDLAQVPKTAWPVLQRFDSQIMESMEALAFPLPNKEVKPGDTWPMEVHYSLSLGGRATANAIIKTTAKYVGMRTRDGREEAVIELLGKAESGSSGGGEEGGGRPGGKIGGGPPSPVTGGGEGSSGGDSGEGEGDRTPSKGIKGLGHGAALIDIQTGVVTLARMESDMAAVFEITQPGPNGQNQTGKVAVGLYLDSLGRRSLTKDKPAQVEVDKLLPNQVKEYSPLVGAADPESLVDAKPAESTPGIDIPVRSTQMKSEALEKASKASVMISITKSEGSAEGSGWFAEPGIIVTNCHVVDMLTKSDRPPTKLDVYIDRGKPSERKMPGEILAIDRVCDLAIVRVKADNLPDPLKIQPSETLQNSENLSVLGFPNGTSKSRTLEQGLGTRDLLTTLQVRPTTVVGRVNFTDGSTKWVQLEGGADHGNSGGPIADANGNVRLVLVAGIDGTEMRFGIPSEYAARMLNGYPMEVEPGYAFMDGSTPKMPISILFSDPLKRLKKVWVDCWVGNPGKPRQGSSKEPEAKPGDGPRQSVEVALVPHKSGMFMEAKADLPLPALNPGQVYYFQPRFIDGTGQMKWAQAAPYTPDGPPLDRKPQVLAIKHQKNSSPRYLELTSTMANLAMVNPSMATKSDYKLVGTYAETVQAVNNKGDALTDLRCTEFKWPQLESMANNPQLAQYRDVIEQMKKYLEIYKSLVTKGVFSKDGRLTKFDTAMAGIPFQALALIPQFHEQMMYSLRTVCIPLPNKEVKYGDTWEQSTNLIVPVARKSQESLFKMKFKYIGTRERAGRKEAIVEIEGQLSQDPKGKTIDLKAEPETTKGDEPRAEGGGATPMQTRPAGGAKDDPKKPRALYGTGKGHAFVDVEGGYVSECEVFIDFEVEIPVMDRETKVEVLQTVNSQMSIGLKRLTSAGKLK